MGVGYDKVVQALEDWRTADIRSDLKAALGFLEKFVPPEEDFTIEDIEKMRAEGMSDAKIRDVMYVGVTFMTMSKSADAFGWPPHPMEVLNSNMKVFLKIPYTLGALIG